MFRGSPELFRPGRHAQKSSGTEIGASGVGKWVIRVPVQRGIFFALRRLGGNCFTNFVPMQGFLKWRVIGQVECVTSVRGCCANL